MFHVGVGPTTFVYKEIEDNSIACSLEEYTCYTDAATRLSFKHALHACCHKEAFGPKYSELSNDCTEAFQRNGPCLSFFCVMQWNLLCGHNDPISFQESVILARWLMGVTIALAAKAPECVHSQ